MNIAEKAATATPATHVSALMGTVDAPPLVAAFAVEEPEAADEVPEALTLVIFVVEAAADV